MEEAIPLLEERFFGDLVMGVVESGDYIRNCMEILYPGRHMEERRCFISDVYIEDYEHFMSAVWEYSYDQLEVNLRNFLRIYQGKYYFHIVYKSGNLIEIIGICTDDEEEKGWEGEAAPDGIRRLNGAMEALISEIEKYFQFRARFKVRKIYENVLQIRQAGETIADGKEDSLMLEQNIGEQKKMVMSNLTTGNIVTAQKLFHNILRELENTSAVKRNNAVIDILSTMNAVLSEINGQLARALQPYFNYTAIASKTRAEEMLEYTDRIFDRIRLADEKKEYYDAGTMVDKAKSYIRENIYKDISQEETANYLYICPSYLSRMFKKQTGESFIQYVTGVKMEKAIELLKDPQYKTYHVSEILGYKTPRYFSRLFRNHTGMNPSEYRGKVLHLGGEYDET